LYSTPDQIGVRGGEVLRQAFSSRILPPPQWPRDFVVRVNQDVARSLGLSIEEAQLAQQLRRSGKAMNRGLRTRMLMLALLPGTLVAVLLTVVFLVHSIDTIEQGLRTRGTAISRHLAALAEFGIFSGQRTALGALSTSALGIDPDVRGAAIVGPRGEILARAGELNPAGWPRLARVEGHRVDGDVLQFIEPVLQHRLPVDDIYGGGLASGAEATPVGYVVLEFSLREVSGRITRLVSIGFVIALLGAALGGWLAYRIATRGDPPAAGRERGCRAHRCRRPRGTDAGDTAGPLRSLATGINDMAARIGLSQEDLRARVAEATAGLQRQKEAAERATLAKSHFLAAASHDLRQPLHALGLFVSALAQSESAKREPELVAHIRSATDSLQNLLDAILDLSRLDGGNVVPRIAAFGLGPVLESVQRDLALVAEHKGLRLRVHPTDLWVTQRRGSRAAHPAQPGGQCLALYAQRRRAGFLPPPW
jgi:signal transduction histidine kinase